jgi:hypothetical protein
VRNFLTVVLTMADKKDRHVIFGVQLDHKHIYTYVRNTVFCVKYKYDHNENL